MKKIETTNSSGFKSVYTVDEHGKKQGLYKEYFDDGNLVRECTYINDKLEGSEKLYYRNGQLQFDRTFKNGEKEGQEKYYDENGQLRLEHTYRGGIIEEAKCYDENGRPMMEAAIKDGKVFGLTYDLAGKIVAIGQRGDDELEHMERLNFKQLNNRKKMSKKLDDINETFPAVALRKRLKEAIVKEFRQAHPKKKEGR